MHHHVGRIQAYPFAALLTFGMGGGMPFFGHGFADSVRQTSHMAAGGTGGNNQIIGKTGFACEGDDGNILRLKVVQGGVDEFKQDFGGC